MRASNGVSLPLAASTDNAPVTTAAAKISSTSNSALSASAVDTCVPFSSASPSLAASDIGESPARRKPSLAATAVPSIRTSPSPISASVMCASGARSPEAPTEPLRRNRRQDAGVIERDQGVDHFGPDAGIAARQARGLEHQNETHGRIVEQRAGADRVRVNEVGLQPLQLIVRDVRLGELAEAGVDAVGGSAVIDRLLHRRPRSVDGRPRCGIERHGMPPRAIRRSMPSVSLPAAMVSAAFIRPTSCSACVRQARWRKALPSVMRDRRETGGHFRSTIGRTSPCSVAHWIASSYPASACRITPLAGSLVSTRSMRRAAAAFRRRRRPCRRAARTPCRRRRRGGC